MADKGKVTRREFIKGVASTGALVYASGMASVKEAFSQGDKSRIFRAGLCPRHDGQLRHQGFDALMDLLAEYGVEFYRTNGDHPWGGPSFPSTITRAPNWRNGSQSILS